ncbi:Peptidase family M28 [Rhizoctonia solani]|uniref:Peptide hydrolase n=1 Tax=Rhizoctonia solani TaxID=456999 RepID=A0A8H7IGQ2_9AGAM|nr:Peptidase family M28 [Rhizoctonia solani]
MNGAYRTGRFTMYTLSRLATAACLFASILGQAVNVPREFKKLSTSDLVSITLRDVTYNVDHTNPKSHLAHILIPRPPDTANNTAVRNYLVKTMKDLNWDVEEDSFTSNTPYGEKRFTNVIATKNPEAPRRLVLAAHFDSKYFATYPDSQFVGATDSAAPCAMLLDLAQTLDGLLNERQKRIDAGQEDEDDNEAVNTTLQIIFFDGEEAFKDWTHTDSLYGARHLAEKWATTYLEPSSKRKLYPVQTVLSTIEHFVLLDLLGTAGALDESDFKWDPHKSGFFMPRTGYQSSWGGIEDDHIPFLERGVSILHIIASPFPRVWHTLADDANALHLPTMKHWNMVLRVFTAEYLGLRPANSSANQPRSESISKATEELVSLLAFLQTEQLLTVLGAVDSPAHNVRRSFGALAAWVGFW